MKKPPKVTASGNPRCPYEVRFWDEDGTRKRKRFKFLLDAENFAEARRSDTTLPEDLRFSSEDRVCLLQIKRACQLAGIALPDAVGLIKRNIPQFSTRGKDWTDAVRAFLGDAQRRDCRPSSISFYGRMLAVFQRDEHPDNIAQITQDRAERYISSCKSPAHSKCVLHAFFNFCVAKKWVASNPFSVRLPNQIKEKHLPQVLSVEDTRILFRRLPGAWRPTFALLAFCGIRPNELVAVDGKTVMRVADIDFGHGRITVPANVAKTRTARIFDPPANVWAWLEPLKNSPRDNPVAPASYAALCTVKRNTGVKMTHDVLRHSFASYGYHFLGAERTVEIMGHVGGYGVFAKHYKGLATPADAEEYFKISPV